MNQKSNRGDPMSPETARMSTADMAALRELAEDLESIVQVVSTRDGDATARQHSRARAVRAALAALSSTPAPPREDDDLDRLRLEAKPSAEEVADMEAPTDRLSGEYLENVEWMACAWEPWRRRAAIQMLSDSLRDGWQDRRDGEAPREPREAVRVLEELRVEFVKYSDLTKMISQFQVRDIIDAKLLALRAEGSSAAQVRQCDARHDQTGARCELPLDHDENHRGAFAHGITQRPYERAEGECPYCGQVNCTGCGHGGREAVRVLEEVLQRMSDLMQEQPNGRYLNATETWNTLLAYLRLRVAALRAEGSS